MISKTYADIDSLINEKGLKFSYVANRIGVSPNYFWRIRKNPSLLSVEQMEDLAEVLGLSFFDIYKVRKKFECGFDKNAKESETTSVTHQRQG